MVVNFIVADVAGDDDVGAFVLSAFVVLGSGRNRLILEGHQNDALGFPHMWDAYLAGVAGTERRLHELNSCRVGPPDSDVAACLASSQ